MSLSLPPTTPTKHGIDVVPPSSVASPHGVDGHPDEDVPWWTPSFSDAARHLGWRWILFIPALLALVGLLALPLRRDWFSVLMAFWKPIVIAIALPTGAAIHAMKTVVQHRKEPFCIHCGYTLQGLPDGHRCPECGRRFSLAVIDEYRRDPQWFVKRWKMHHAMLPRADAPFDVGPARTSNKRNSRDGT